MTDDKLHSPITCPECGNPAVGSSVNVGDLLRTVCEVWLGRRDRRRTRRRVGRGGTRTMSERYVEIEDGEWAVWSTVVEDWVATELSEHDLVVRAGQRASVQQAALADLLADGVLNRASDQFACEWRAERDS